MLVRLPERSVRRLARDPSVQASLATMLEALAWLLRWAPEDPGSSDVLLWALADAAGTWAGTGVLPELCGQLRKAGVAPDWQQYGNPVVFLHAVQVVLR